MTLKDKSKEEIKKIIRFLFIKTNLKGIIVSSLKEIKKKFHFCKAKLLYEKKLLFFTKCLKVL